jgi:RND family efflux transporter MFP subunit
VKDKVDLSQLAIERDAPPPTTRRRSHLVSRYVLPLVLVGGFLALVAWAGRDVVFPPRPVTVVPVMTSRAAVSQAGMPLFEAAGWIEPRPTPIRVAALAPGVVEQLLVVEDQAVAAGEPVAELIKDDAQLACQRAKANQQLQEAALAEARAQLRAATTRFEQPVHLVATLGEAEAALAKIETELQNLPFATRRAEADLEFARQNLDGKRASEGAVAGRAIDQAHSSHDGARALVEELRDRRASLENERKAFVQRRDALETQLKLLADEKRDREEAAARVAAAAARVEQARVAVAEAKLRLDRMSVRAPVDGRVYQLIGYPGSTLSGGMRDNTDGSTVVTMYQPGRLQVRVDVRFEDIPKVALGQAVEIDNPALHKPLAGHVLFVSSVADIQKNTLEVKVAIDAPEPVFKPDMLVDVTFLAPPLPETDAATGQAMRILIPQQFVQQDDAGPFVWVADQAAGVARRAAIEPGGVEAGGMVHVADGLTVSSRLIASGTDGLADGQRIRVTGEHAGAQVASAARPDRKPLSRLPRGETQ